MPTRLMATVLLPKLPRAFVTPPSAFRQEPLGNSNTYIGYKATANGVNISNSTALGNGAVVYAANMVRVGNYSVNTSKGRSHGLILLTVD